MTILGTSHGNNLQNILFISFFLKYSNLSNINIIIIINIGFDPKGSTTGFMIWIYGMGIMVINK